MLYNTDYRHPMKAKIKEILNFGPIWQTKYASAVSKNLGLRFDFWPISSSGGRSPCCAILLYVSIVDCNVTFKFNRYSIK